MIRIENIPVFSKGQPARLCSFFDELKAYVDSLGGLWFQGKLLGKAAGGFTSTSTTHGGNETTILSLFAPLSHLGFIIVPNGYGDPATFRAGTPYGSSATSGQTATKPSEDDLAVATYQGRRLAKVAKALKSIR